MLMGCQPSVLQQSNNLTFTKDEEINPNLCNDNQKKKTKRRYTRRYREIRPKIHNKIDDLLSKKMESVVLNTNVEPMPRCSSPSFEYCGHCEHDHNRKCCLYFGDVDDDGPKYSLWKRDLERPIQSVAPYSVPKIPEAVAGATTPKGFPSFTYNNPGIMESQQKAQNRRGLGGVPSVWFRQFYYPLLSMDIIQGIPVTTNTADSAQTAEPPKPSQLEHPLPYPLCCNTHFMLSQQANNNNPPPLQPIGPPNAAQIIIGPPQQPPIWYGGSIGHQPIQPPFTSYSSMAFPPPPMFFYNNV